MKYILENTQMAEIYFILSINLHDQLIYGASKFAPIHNNKNGILVT